MTNIDDTAQWVAHQPTWGPPVDPPRDREVTGCTACKWAAGPKEHPPYAFGAHLAELGAPDYMVTYWKSWAHLVETMDGRLDRDAVARELFDYGTVMEGASRVYSELADLSKPNTAPGHIISRAEQKFREVHAQHILDSLLPRVEDEESRKAIIAFAEETHQGAWEDFQESERLLEEARARRKN